MTKQQFIDEIAKYVQKYAPQFGIKVYSNSSWYFFIFLIMSFAIIYVASNKSSLYISFLPYITLR